MSIPGPAGPARAGLGGESPPELAAHLGYLLKHAQQRLAEFTGQALAPYGIDGRQLAVLLVLAGQGTQGPASQQDAAQRLGVDRTTMVGLLDVLEDKGLVTRHPARADRRKNVVELTPAGHGTLRAATEASDEAERRFLGGLPAADAARLKEVLRLLIAGRD